MSTVHRTQEVVITRQVQVTTCDGPGCTNEYVLKDSHSDEEAVGWHLAAERRTVHDWQQWNFCSLRCLTAWAVRREQVGGDEGGAA